MLERITGVWPTACILTLSPGCYFGPIDLIDSNTTPVIYSSNVKFNEPLQIEKDLTRVVVYASDDDEASLSAAWDLSDDGFIHDAQTSYDPVFWTQVELELDDDLDGQILTVRVNDGVNNASESWQLEVVR